MENILNDLRRVFKDMESIQSKLVYSDELEGKVELECLEHINTSMRNISLAKNLVDRSNFIDITTTNVVEGVYIKPTPDRYAKWII